MPLGRPTKYDAAFCEQVIKLGKQGMGKLEMASNLGIGYESFETYQKDYPLFSKAVRAALQESQAWWEMKGRKATFGEVDGFNATSFIFNMKNRFKDDWKDKVETEHSGSIAIPDNRKSVVQRFLGRVK